jgi:NAD-dependent DNA ligase
VSALVHAYSRDALDITGTSEARIQQLMEEDFLKIPSDVFRLAKNETQLEELAELEG